MPSLIIVSGHIFRLCSVARHEQYHTVITVIVCIIGDVTRYFRCHVLITGPRVCTVDQDTCQLIVEN